MAERQSTSRRQMQRRAALQDAHAYIRKTYCGTGNQSGQNTWPFSRHARRSMERDRAKREFKVVRQELRGKRHSEAPNGPTGQDAPSSEHRSTSSSSE